MIHFHRKISANLCIYIFRLHVESLIVCTILCESPIPPSRHCSCCLSMLISNIRLLSRLVFHLSFHSSYTLETFAHWISWFGYHTFAYSLSVGKHWWLREFYCPQFSTRFFSVFVHTFSRTYAEDARSSLFLYPSNKISFVCVKISTLNTHVTPFMKLNYIRNSLTVRG